MLQADRVDYLEIVHPETLVPLAEIDGSARAGGGLDRQDRLIDNLEL